MTISEKLRRSERKAFEAWCKDNPPPYSRRGEMAEAWQAACAWQRERDAKLCKALQVRHETRAEILPEHDEEVAFAEGEACGAEDCADAIRSQHD